MATAFLVSSVTTELIEQVISVRVKNTISAARTVSSHGPLLPARKQRPRLAHDSVPLDRQAAGAEPDPSRGDDRKRNYDATGLCALLTVRLENRACGAAHPT